MNIGKQGYDKIPLNYFDAILYVDLVTRQTVEHANQIPCKNNQQNYISLDPITYQYYVLSRQPNKKDPPHFFNLLKFNLLLDQVRLLPKMQVFFSQKEPKSYWNRVLLPNTVIKYYNFLGKLLYMNF